MTTTQHSNDDVDIHSFKTYFDNNQGGDYSRLGV